MTFPVSYPDQQALTDYITQNRDGFVNVAQGSPLRDQPYQMDRHQRTAQLRPAAANTRNVVLKFFRTS